MKIETANITNENATSLLAAGAAAIAAGDVEFDLSAVKMVDSAAVALLLEWQRMAQARGARLSLTGVPPALTGLADLYGVDELLGLPHHATA